MSPASRRGLNPYGSKPGTNSDFRCPLKMLTRNRRCNVWRCVLVNFLFLLSLALAATTIPEQKVQYTTEAGIDTDGNIYVASEGGKPINMATVGHCIEARFADDRQ